MWSASEISGIDYFCQLLPSSYCWSGHLAIIKGDASKHTLNRFSKLATFLNSELSYTCQLLLDAR